MLKPNPLSTQTTSLYYLYFTFIARDAVTVHGSYCIINVPVAQTWNNSEQACEILSKQSMPVNNGDSIIQVRCRRDNLQIELAGVRSPTLHSDP